MPSYYQIIQGKTINEEWFSPKFPLTKENINENIKNGLMIEITKEEAFKDAAWGTGNYCINDDKTYNCVKSNFDSSD